MSKNIRQAIYGLGYKKQAALQTASLATDIWKISKLNPDLLQVQPVTEDDSQEYGKGNEYATAQYPVAMNVGGSVEKYLSSEFAAWLFNFALGSVTHTGTTANIYTAVPTNVCDSIDLPAFTCVEQLGPGCPGGAALDRAAIGNVISDFSIAITSGPGRKNVTAKANFVGCGKVTSPSGIVIPDTEVVEHPLNAGGASVSISGVDYVSNKNLLSLNFGVNNAPRLDQGYYIGSGSQNGFQIRGCVERADRVITLGFTARYDENSLELAKLLAMTEGPAVFSLKGALISGTDYNGMSVNLPRVAFKSAVLGNDNGILTVQVDCTPMWHTTNGILTCTATTPLADIG